jgi:hypothetical protein
MRIEPLPWHEIGEVRLGPDGKLLMPDPGRIPGVYRLRLAGRAAPSVYIGESDDITRRFGHYRNPEPSQRTNVRMNERMRTRLEEGGIVHVAVVTGAVLWVGDCAEPLDLEDRLLAGSRWRDDPRRLVFTTTVGTPMDGIAVTRRFQSLLEGAGLPRQRFHDLRHACASLLLAQGVAPRVVMETLGHSQISLTLNTYSHVIPALGRAAADQMDAVLRPRPEDIAAG